MEFKIGDKFEFRIDLIAITIIAIVLIFIYA